MRLPHIVLITVDSLRADRCGFLGYFPNTTPFLKEEAQKGIVFDNFYSNSVQTAFSFPVIMTGTPPFSWGYYLGIPPFVKTLAEYMRVNFGYRTFGIVSTNPALSSDYGYNRGFDLFKNYSEVSIKDKSKGAWVLRSVKDKLKQFPLFRKFRRAPKILPDAKWLVREVLGILGSNPYQPFFVWLHLMDVHIPYNGYEGYMRLYEPTPLDFLYGRMWKYYVDLIEIWRDLKSLSQRERSPRRVLKMIKDRIDPSTLSVVKKIYDGAVYNVDKSLEELVEGLRRSQIDGYIVITSDHGEAFMEHGYPGHEPLGLHNELIKVPLLILSTFENFGVRVRQPLSHVDLKSIIVRLVNNRPTFYEDEPKECVFVEVPFGYISPQFEISNWYTLFNPIHFSFALIKGHFKFIQHSEMGDYELYNLEADPNELMNIAAENSDMVKMMLELILDYRKDREKKYMEERREMFALRFKMNLIKHLRSRDSLR